LLLIKKYYSVLVLACYVAYISTLIAGHMDTGC